MRDGKVLLLRRFNTGYEDGNYSVIAGHVDGDETITDTMMREAKEEAGISIDRDELRVVHVMHRKKGEEERIDFFFVCDRWNGEIRSMEPDKCDEMRWASVDSLPANVIPYVRQAFDNFQKNIFFSEFGW